MKKILFLTSYMSGYGGVEKVTQRICKIVNNKISILSLSDGTYKKSFLLNKLVDKVDWIPKSKGCYLRFMFSNKYINTLFHVLYTYNYILRDKPDVIIATGPMQIKYTRKLLQAPFIRKKNIALYGWPHFSKESGYGDFNTFKYADKILCISKGILNEFKNMNIDEAKLYYLPNPFEEKERVIDISSGVFYYIGRLQWGEQKNIKELLLAIMKTKTNVNLKIIGDGKDLSRIKEFISINELTDRVKILNGWYEDPWEIVHHCKGLVLTSKFEGLPTVIGEALALGVPVISSDCETGPKDFIVNGVNGFLYNMNNIDQLANLLDAVNTNEFEFNTKIIKDTMKPFYNDSFSQRFNSLIG